MGISGKIHVGLELHDVRTLASLPIFDVSGDVSQSLVSFYDLMHSDDIEMIQSDRDRIISYLDFLSDVSVVATRMVHSSMKSEDIKEVSLHPSGIMTATTTSGTIADCNLLDVYTAARSSSIMDQTKELKGLREKREALRERLDTESLFDGKILIKYAPAAFIGGRVSMETKDVFSGTSGSRGVVSSLQKQS